MARVTAPAGKPLRYIVCGSRPWNRTAFERLVADRPGRWELVTKPDELAAALAREPAPRFVFFLHWSWIVPEQVVGRHECVVFHMTDVPFGRGGSPLQNLIRRGFERTTVCAIRMVAEVDAGPVYLRRELGLSGTAEEVYLRADRLGTEMIAEIVDSEPQPSPQEGEAVVFTRRTPPESALPDDLADLDAMHDFIRMLDADSYPHAFLDHGRFRIHFTRATRYHGRVVVDATITDREPES